MKIINIEYLKLKGNTSFKVFTLFFIVFLPIIIFTIPLLMKDGFFGESTYPLLPRSFETTWYFTAYVASWFSMFLLSFILIFHVTNEYTYKTVRQNILDGYSRYDFLKSKLYMMFFIAIVATVYVFIVGFSAGFYFQTFEVQAGLSINPLDIMNPESIENPMELMTGMDEVEDVSLDFGSFTDGIGSVLSYFVQVLGYLTFAVFIGFLLKRGATSVIVFFSLFIVEFIAGAYLSYQELPWISENLPLATFSAVLPNPGLTEIVMGLETVETLDTTKVLVSLAYIVLFLFLTKVIFFRRDVA